jgi:hypothetical protein
MPVRVLARVFGRLILEYLEEAVEGDELSFFGALASLRNRRVLLGYLPRRPQIQMGGLRQTTLRWTEQVLDCVARYTHRVAIANDRLIAIGAGKVPFRWKV